MADRWVLRRGRSGQRIEGPKLPFGSPVEVVPAATADKLAELVKHALGWPPIYRTGEWDRKARAVIAEFQESVDGS